MTLQVFIPTIQRLAARRFCGAGVSQPIRALGRSRIADSGHDAVTKDNADGDDVGPRLELSRKRLIKFYFATSPVPRMRLMPVKKKTAPRIPETASTRTL